MAADEASDREMEQAFSPTPTPVAPAGETTPQVQPAAPEAPEAPAAVDTEPSLWDGTPINPDTLPPEVQPLAKQLQAAFTRKTQELAEERKQIEAFGSTEEIEQAVGLFHRIQDPRNWQDIYSELTSAMQQYGMTPAEAHVAATEAMHEAQQPAAPQAPAGDPFAALEADPELAPLAQHVRAMQARLDSFEQEQQARSEAELAERHRLALVGEITRQEGAIRQANPKYKEQDVDMVYELSSFHNGNLIEAQQSLERYVAYRFAEMLAEKEALGASTGAVTPGAVSTVTSHEVREPESIQDVAAELEESIRQQVAAGEISLDDF